MWKIHLKYWTLSTVVCASAQQVFFLEGQCISYEFFLSPFSEASCESRKLTGSHLETDPVLFSTAMSLRHCTSGPRARVDSWVPIFSWGRTGGRQAWWKSSSNHLLKEYIYHSNKKKLEILQKHVGPHIKLISVLNVWRCVQIYESTFIKSIALVVVVSSILLWGGIILKQLSS